jgi:dienelactone hydrolase
MSEPASAARSVLPSGTDVYVVRPSGTAVRGLVLFPDIMGLRQLFFDLCDSLATERGWAVAAIELWPGQGHLALDDRLGLVGDLDDARFLADAQDAAGLLGVTPVAALGFCMGGMLALKAASLDRFDRVVSCYGMIRLPQAWKSASMGHAFDLLESGGAALAAKVLAVVGTVDPYLPAEDVDDLEALGATVVRYDGAEHGFMHDPSRPTHRPDDAADAWRRIGDWLAVER